MNWHVSVLLLTAVRQSSVDGSNTWLSYVHLSDRYCSSISSRSSINTIDVVSNIENACVFNCVPQISKSVNCTAFLYDLTHGPIIFVCVFVLCSVSSYLSE